MSPLDFKAEVSRPEPCKVSIQVEVPKEKVKERADIVFSQVQKSAVLPGFRQGKVPQDMVRKSFADIARDELLNKMIPDVVDQVVKEHNLAPIGETEVDALEFDFDQPLKFKASFEIKPEVTPKNYKNLAVEKEKLAVGDKEIDVALDSLRQRGAQLVVAGRDTVNKGDYVVVDYEIFSGGQPIPDGKVHDQVALVEEKQLLPKFAEQLVGMKKGEMKDILITMPADFQKKELAGKEAVFKLTLKEIKERKLPELNDDFAKELGENMTLAQLKEKIGKNITLQEEARIRKDMEDQVVNALIAGHDFPLPNILVARQVEYLVERSKQYLEQQGQKPEDLGLTDEILRAKVKHDAERQVKTYLLLEAIGREEKLVVTEDEITAEMEKTIKHGQQPAEQVREFFTKYRSQVLSQMEEEKVFKFLIDNASVKEVKAKKKPAPEHDHDHEHDHAADEKK